MTESNRLPAEEALTLLRSHGFEGTDDELMTLVDACDADGAILDSLKVKDGKVACSGNWYWVDSSGYVVLGRKLGRFRCGLHLTSVADRLAREANNQFTDIGLSSIAHDRALFLIDLGELKQAEEILRGPAVSEAFGFYPGVEGRLLYEFPARLNLCDVLVLTGRLAEAHFVSNVMVGLFETDAPDPDSRAPWPLSQQLYGRVGIGEYVQMYRYTTGFNPYARRALAESLQGKIADALADFKLAEAFQQRKYERSFTAWRKYHTVKSRYERKGLEPPREEMRAAYESEHVTLPLIGQAAIYYAMLLMRLGKLNTAVKIFDYSRRWAADPLNHFPGMQAFAEVALSDAHRLLGNYDEAPHYLERPLAWAADTGQKEIACWAHLSLARLALAQERLEDAETAITECLQIAASHGFRLYEMDALVTAGRLAMLRGDFETVDNNAETVARTAGNPYCGYAWAHGNALHLLAEAYLHPDYDRDRPLEKAEHLVSGAILIRDRIRDPRAANSRDLAATVAAQRS